MSNNFETLPHHDSEPNRHNQLELQKTIDCLVTLSLLLGAKRNEKNQAITVPETFYGYEEVTLELLPHSLIIRTLQPAQTDNDHGIQRIKTTLDLPLTNNTDSIIHQWVEKPNEDGSLSWYEQEIVHNNVKQSAETDTYILGLNYRILLYIINDLDMKKPLENMQAPSDEALTQALSFMMESLIQRCKNEQEFSRSEWQITPKLDNENKGKNARTYPQMRLRSQNMKYDGDRWWMNKVDIALDLEDFGTVLSSLGLPEITIMEPFASSNDFSLKTKIVNELSKNVHDWENIMKTLYTESQQRDWKETLTSIFVDRLESTTHRTFGEVHGVILDPENGALRGEILQRNRDQQDVRNFSFDDEPWQTIASNDDKLTALRVLAEHRFLHTFT